MTGNDEYEGQRKHERGKARGDGGTNATEWVCEVAVTCMGEILPNIAVI